ncbi:unnamed protein product, partial [Linum tenue]
MGETDSFFSMGLHEIAAAMGESDRTSLLPQLRKIEAYMGLKQEAGQRAHGEDESGKGNCLMDQFASAPHEAAMGDSYQMSLVETAKEAIKHTM